MEKERDLNPFGKAFWYAVGIIILVFGLITLITPANAADLKKLNEQVFAPSVQLGEFCSGTVIYSDREKESGDVTTMVLTAKHCVDDLSDKDTIKVNIDKYNENLRKTKTESYVARRFGMSYKADLALLKLVDTDTVFTAGKVAPKEMGEKLQFGQEVVTVGHPLGLSRTFTQGNLGFVEDLGTFGSYYRATPAVAPGSSGGSMWTLDDKGDYVLIGTTTAGYFPVTFMNYFTTIEDINEYLETARKSYEVNKEDEKKETVGASR